MSIKDKFSKVVLEPKLVGVPRHILEYPDAIMIGGSEPWAWKVGSEYVPKPVRDAAKEAIDSKLIHCGDSRGTMEFKEAVSRKVKEFNGIEADPEDEILVSPGSGHSLHLATMTFLDPGDEVITTDPTFSFSTWGGNLSRARVKYIPISPKNEWKITPEEIEERITPKTKLLYFTDPDNPTGRVFTKNDVEGIAQVAQEHDLIVLVDQNFDRVTYDGVKHYSFAALAGMKERTVTIWSMSKEYALSSFRIGYTVAHKDVIERMRVLQIQNGSAGASPIFQRAAKVAMETYSDDLWKEWVAYWQKGRDITVPMVNDIPGMSTTLPKGCYALYADISKFGRSLEVCTYIAEKAHVLPSPGMWFGPEVGDRGIRIVYGGIEHEKLIEALKRMKEVMGEHPANK